MANVYPFGAGGKLAAGLYDDGDFRTAQRAGPEMPEVPFESDGDASTVLWRSEWVQDADAWTKLPAGTMHPERPSIFLLEESGMQMEEGNLMRWQRLYGPVPRTRVRPGSIAYNFQYADVVLVPAGEGLPLAVGSITLKEITWVVPARIEKSYHLLLRAADIDKVALPNKDTLIQVGPRAVLGHGTGKLVLDIATDGAFAVSPDPFIVAQDAVLTPWKGPIHERTIIRIAGPTRAFWGAKLVSLSPGS